MKKDTMANEATTTFPPEINNLLEKHGIDRTDTTAAINLLIRLKLATVRETDDQIVIIYNSNSEQETSDIDQNNNPQCLAAAEEIKPNRNVFTPHQPNKSPRLSSPENNKKLLNESFCGERSADIKNNKKNLSSSESDQEILEESACSEPSVDGKENKGGVDVDLDDFSPNVLEFLLNETLIGKTLLQQAKSGILSKRRQLDLAEIVTSWHFAHKTKLHERDLQKYSRVIVLLFKNEKQDSYFLPRGGDKRNPGGKIANKINTLKNRARKRRLYDENYLSHLKHTNNSVTEHGEDLNSSGREALEWLTTNDAPWTTVLVKWKASFPVRSKLLKKSIAVEELIIAKLWSLITSEYGHQLVGKFWAQERILDAYWLYQVDSGRRVVK
ncbi:uncharacterized protein LOC129716927 [Wyeomyia smithii]|uniref:uncharacterized protein LOC129716927 n=1 Tax=Wyeomyia smithii TaxID=174621 RepID=UPI002467E5E8|nr:uncharacterized protein LOC129716927 [Wyeomyia smithii]